MDEQATFILAVAGHALDVLDSTRDALEAYAAGHPGKDFSMPLARLTWGIEAIQDARVAFSTVVRS